MSFINILVSAKYVGTFVNFATQVLTLVQIFLPTCISYLGTITLPLRYDVYERPLFWIVPLETYFLAKNAATQKMLFSNKWLIKGSKINNYILFTQFFFNLFQVHLIYSI